MRKTTTGQVYDHIIELILHGKLKPGDRIRRRDIAQQLKVSVTPVGEAMLQLELEGLIKTRPRQGTYITNSNADELNDQMLVRLAVECQAARLYCGNRISDNIEHLHELATTLDQTDHHSVDYAIRDTHFHRELVTLSGSKSLLDVYDRVMRLGLLLFRYASQTPGNRKGTHTKLLEQLKTTDPDQAEAAIRKNISGTKSQFAVFLDQSRAKVTPVEKRLARSMQKVVKTRTPKKKEP